MPDHLLNQNSFDVVVLGHPGVDTNVYLPSYERGDPHATTFTETIDYVAHAAGFVSRGFAQLRLKTALLGFVGDDHCGRFVRDELARDGIDLSGLSIDPMGTARSVNFVYPGGQRKNFYDGKGHMKLQPDLELGRNIISRSKLVYFTLSNWARGFLPITRDCGAVVACDLQDIPSPDDPYRRDFIHHADILFFSAAGDKAAGADPTVMIQALLDLGRTKIVVAGLGAQGCALGTRESIHFFPPAQLPDPVLDTNGAGDSLAVGFLASYVSGDYSLEDSIRRGQISARHTCTLRGDSTNLISMELLEGHFCQK